MSTTVSWHHLLWQCGATCDAWGLALISLLHCLVWSFSQTRYLGRKPIRWHLLSSVNDAWQLFLFSCRDVSSKHCMCCVLHTCRLWNTASTGSALSLSNLWPGQPHWLKNFHHKFPAFCRCIENISCFSPTVFFTEDAVGFHFLFLFLCANPPFSRVRADARHAARLALFVNTNLFPFSFSCHLPFLVSPRFYLVLTTSVGRWVSLPSPQSSH